MFPAVAVYEKIASQKELYRVIFFIGPRDSRFKSYWDTDVYTLPARGFPGLSLSLIPFLWNTSVNVFRTIRLFMAIKPDLVVGFGGFVSLAPIVAGLILKKKIVLTEQNTIPGKVNRLFARYASLILNGLPDTESFWPESVREKVAFTGLPIRATANRHNRTTVFERKEDTMTVLIFGGSQGALFFNTIIDDLLAFLSGYEKKIRFIHLSGRHESRSMRLLYSDHGFEARCYAFYDHIGELYASTDIAVCRAGAGTLSELAAAGIPALVVPLPNSKDNHQYYNAQLFVKAGAAEMIEQKDCTPKMLAQRIELYYNEPSKRRIMQNAMRKIAVTDAAEQISNRITGLLDEV